MAVLKRKPSSVEHKCLNVSVFEGRNKSFPKGSPELNTWFQKASFGSSHTAYCGVPTRACLEVVEALLFLFGRENRAAAGLQFCRWPRASFSSAAHATLQPRHCGAEMEVGTKPSPSERKKTAKADPTPLERKDEGGRRAGSSRYPVPQLGQAACQKGYVKDGKLIWLYSWCRWGNFSILSSPGSAEKEQGRQFLPKGNIKSEAGDWASAG